jgi:DNA-damage-inducible protein D
MDNIIQITDDTQGLSFEDFKNQNGITFWWASDVYKMLGYKSLTSFKEVIKRVARALDALKIDHWDNIVKVERNGGEDYKLTRFAVYLAAQNGDPKKPEVARMQAYFAAQTRRMETMGGETLERLVTRQDLIDGNKGLCGAAKDAGVTDYARFINSGFIGMYNMMNVRLAERRGVDKTKLYDTMGRAELAANLFRVTLTEARMKAKDVKGQTAAEIAHMNVGQDVRRMVIENTGMTPEMLPQSTPLPEVCKALKKDNKELRKIDRKE